MSYENTWLVLFMVANSKFEKPKVATDGITPFDTLSKKSEIFLVVSLNKRVII
jgi:hypothetical protein